MRRIPDGGDVVAARRSARAAALRVRLALEKRGRRDSVRREVRGARPVTQAELDWVEGEVRAGRGLYSVAKQTGRAEATYRRYLYGSRRVPAPGEWSPSRRRSVPLARSQQQENEDRQE